MSLRERLAFFEQKPLETGALIAGGASIAGSLLEILKNMLLASRFGASAELDVYFAAFRVPDLLYGVFISGVLSVSFFPIFARVLLAGKEGAWKLASALIAFFSTVLGVGALAVFVFARPIAQLLAPGFSPLQNDLLISLLRVLMLQPIFMALANLFADMLQSFKRVFVSALAPAFYNGGAIVGIVLFSQRMGIYGVVWGVILGSLSYALVQVPALRAIGFKFSWSWRETLNDVRDMCVLTVPHALLLVADNAMLVWITMLSSLLSIGSLSIYSFTGSLQSLPQTIIALSFASVAFPQLAGQWVAAAHEQDDVAREKGKAKFLRLFDAVAGQIMAWLIPCAFLLAAFTDPIVRVLFGHGNFNGADQYTAMFALAVFAVGVPAAGLLMHLVRTFFAMEDTKHPIFAAFLSLFVAFPAAWFLALRFGVPGLIAGIVLGAWFHAAYLMWLFTNVLGTGYLPRFWYGIARGIVVGSVAALAGAGVYYGSGLFVKSPDFLIILARGVVSGSISLLVLGASIFVYKLIDLATFFDREQPGQTPGGQGI